MKSNSYSANKQPIHIHILIQYRPQYKVKEPMHPSRVKEQMDPSHRGAEYLAPHPRHVYQSFVRSGLGDGPTAGGGSHGAGGRAASRDGVRICAAVRSRARSTCGATRLGRRARAGGRGVVHAEVEGDEGRLAELYR